MTYLNNFKPGQTKSTLLAWSLFVSVLLNLFLVGAFLGAAPAMKHKPFGPIALGGPHGEYMVEWMAHYLDPRDADTFRSTFAPQADALKLAHEHMHQALGDVSAVFQQSPPDRDALQKALDRLSQAQTETHNVTDQILQDAYTKLSPDARHRLADLSQNPF